jgi:hypothetical protein
LASWLVLVTLHMASLAGILSPIVKRHCAGW